MTDPYRRTTAEVEIAKQRVDAEYTGRCDVSWAMQGERVIATRKLSYSSRRNSAKTGYHSLAHPGSSNTTTSATQSNASHCFRISSASDGSSVMNSRPTEPSWNMAYEFEHCGFLSHASEKNSLRVHCPDARIPGNDSRFSICSRHHNAG
jgi:hypothetical protein